MIYEKLAKIQSSIKVSKSRHNDFGNFNFRSAEDIYKAFKKIQSDYGVALIVSDDTVQVGGGVYVKSTAKLIDIETGESVETCASAKEPTESKAKMDESQTSGSAASYARKYALSALFLLDDGVDPDSNRYVDSGEKATDAQIKVIEELCVKHNVNKTELYKRRKVKNGIPTASQAGAILNQFKKNFGEY